MTGSWSPKNCECNWGAMGLSARAVVSYGADYPHDPSDLCRCLHVSRCPPEHMRSRSAHWNILVDFWDELAELLEEEHPSGRCVRTYALMKELFRRVDSHRRPALYTKTCLSCGRQANRDMIERDTAGFLCANKSACLRRRKRAGFDGS